MTDRNTFTEICHRLAEEKWYSRFTAAARQLHSDMGLISLSVVAYTNKNGQLVVDMLVPTMFSVNSYSQIRLAMTKLPTLWACRQSRLRIHMQTGQQI